MPKDDPEPSPETSESAAPHLPLDKRRPADSVCALCERQQPLTFHHLIPRAVHSRKRFRKIHTREELHKRGLWICRLCHNGIHDLIPDEKELARFFHSRELLLSHPAVAKHVAWVKKQR